MNIKKPTGPETEVTPRKRSGPRRFGLGRFLIIVTVVCIGFGWWYQRTSQNSRAVKFLDRQDVYFRYFRNRFNNFPEVPVIEAPDWQRRLCGDEYFLKIKMLGMSGDQASSAAFWKALKKHRHALQNVELIVIGCEGATVSDDSVATLSLLSGLRAVEVEGRVSSNWLHQCRSLKNLNSLRIESPSVPVDPKDLAGLKQIGVIVLHKCGLNLDDAEYLRDQLRSTMIVVLENTDTNIFY